MAILFKGAANGEPNFTIKNPFLTSTEFTNFGGASRMSETSFHFYAGNGRGGSTKRFEGSDFTFSQNLELENFPVNIVESGTINSYDSYSSSQGAGIGTIIYSNFKLAGLNLNFDKNSANEFTVSLEDSDVYSFVEGDFIRGRSLFAGGGDDVLTDALDNSDNDTSVKLDLGSGNDILNLASTNRMFEITLGEGADKIHQSVASSSELGLRIVKDYNPQEDVINFVDANGNAFAGELVLSDSEEGLKIFSGADEMFLFENVTASQVELVDGVLSGVQDPYDDIKDGMDTLYEPVEMDAQNETMGDVSQTQYLFGTGKETFVINGQSDDYGWGPTEDGTGIVIWNLETHTHDILWNYSAICFADQHIDVSDITAEPIPPTNEIVDVVGVTQFLEGKEGNDRFVIDGSSDDFGWDKTDDGTGVVVWDKKTLSHDILWDYEEIAFNDETIAINDMA